MTPPPDHAPERTDDRGRPHRHHGARRFAGNFLFLLMARAVAAFSIIIVSAVAARYLGVAGFGIFASVAALATVLKTVADLGFEDIICREIARDTSRAGIHVSTMTVLRMFMGTFLFALSAFMVFRFSSWPADVKLAACVFIAAELVGSMAQAYQGVMRAFENMRLVLFSNLVHKLCTVGFTILAVLLDRGLAGLAWARLAAALVFLTFTAAQVYGRFVKVSLRYDSHLARAITVAAVPLGVFIMFHVIIVRVDLFFLNVLGHSDFVALFDCPNRLLMQFQIIPITLGATALPMLSRAAAERSNALLTEYYRRTFKLMLLMATPVAALLAIGGRPIMTMLFGIDYAPAADALNVMAASLIGLALSCVQDNVLVSMGRQSSIMLYMALALAIKAFLDVLLVPRYGYMGASVATLFSYALITLFTTCLVRREKVDAGWGMSHTKILFAGVLTLLAGFISLSSPFATFTVRMLVGGGIFLTALLVMRALTRDEIAVVRHVLDRRGGPPRGPGAMPPPGTGTSAPVFQPGMEA